MHFSNALIWLENRVRSHNPNRYSTDIACSILHDHVDKLGDILERADDIVLNSCVKSSPRDPKGSCLLTNTSIKIGKFVEDFLEIEERKWYDRVAIGNLILSALHGFGFIKVQRDPTWEGNPTETPYIITKLKDTKPKVWFSPEAPIPAVSSLFQGHKRTLMKRWGRKDSAAFSELLSKPFVKAADVLQGTRWRINMDVYRTALRNRHELILSPVEVPEEDSPARKEALRHNSISAANRKILLKAAKLRKQDGFYQYVDFDWRGRTYYCETFLNYQSNDLAKSMMEFYTPEELNESGNFWLAVHTANSFNISFKVGSIPDYFAEDYDGFLRSQGLEDISLDKMTLEDRARWTEENIEVIVEAGRVGALLDKAEKPYVALACCIAWRDYYDGLPIRLPVPVDGSNNGWQHLGAMSKDRRTGDLVGLVPKHIPNDFYVRCAQKLQDIDPEWFEGRGMPMKAVRKGIAKRGAMTRAYSAGKTTIAENMYDDVWKERYNEEYGITEEDCTRLAAGLVEAIEQVCPGPMETMDYLQALADHSLEAGNTYITWESPSGYPVKQEYYRADPDDCFRTIWPVRGTLHPAHTPIGKEHREGGRKKTKTRKKILGKLMGYTGEIHHAAKVYQDNYPDYKKVVSGISPNFVHSQDAAHMSLIIAEWQADFGAVHDSFSVHASRVEDLLALTKDVFIQMYDVDNFFDVMRDNILENPEDFTGEQPQLGTLDIQEVHDSDYFFA